VIKGVQLEKKKSRSSIKLFGQYPGRLASYSENGVERMFAVNHIVA
jgi:hypothetical protein